MDNQQRLKDLQAKLDALNGLDERLYEQLSEHLSSEIDMQNSSDDSGVKVAMFDTKTYDKEYFDKLNPQKIQLRTIAASLNEQTVDLAKGCEVVCIFVNDKCDANTVMALEKIGVRLIALRCAGFNNVDLEACKRHNISVVRVPEYSPHAVAEHSVALMMMLNRQLHKAYMRNRAGQYVLDGLVGFDMFGKTVAVLGTGKIGACVIEILSGFGCKILAYDKYPNPRLGEMSNVDYTSIENIISAADIITLHIPLSDESKHIINDAAIGKMKRGVMLINTSRGGLVDTSALIRGLKTGIIGSAGLDVYEEEANIFFHDISNQVLNDEVFARLTTFNNVIITSHQAFLTQEALSNIAETTIENILEYAAGKRFDELSNSVVC
ncbi:D-isomer specific 2-hydroxyacid dehydrogenase, NAD-binding protein [Glaciecola sp. KUL10]|nr:D-isomer specific 2-hydroxyacid dehydrogenase, NAD-binding protein [Glaciecola sp. KUL10]